MGVFPSDETQRAIITTLRDAMAATFLASIAYVGRLASGIWQDALEEGVVTGGTERFEADLLLSLVDADTRRALTLSDTEQARVRRYLETRFDRPAVTLWGGYQRAFLDRAEQVTRRAAIEGWDAQRYRAQLTQIAAIFGEAGFTGAVADTWFRTMVVSRVFNDATTEAFTREPTVRLFPYFEYLDRGDEKVRDNHRLGGFVAATSWPGWRTLSPPRGWNCRCRKRPISVKEARRRFGEQMGKTFPLGTGNLTNNRLNPDPGFESLFSL